MEFFYKPWPWYVAGPLIGATVPILLLLGNKKLGISSSLTQICAACVPSGVTSLKFDWQKDGWNILFVAGVLLGGFLGGYVFANTLCSWLHFRSWYTWAIGLAMAIVAGNNILLFGRHFVLLVCASLHS